MENRELGSLVVSALGLGCLGMTGGYGPAEADRCAAAIRRAVDLGVSLVDTADFYGGGANEELVGRAVRGIRDRVVLATRGGARSRVPGGPPVVLDGTPTYLHRACDASLRRLGVDHVDLYYLARVDPDVPVAESVGALAELVAAGKVRHIGLSEAAPADVRGAHAVHPITAVESEYSLWERGVREEVLPALRELGIGFVAHTPLGKGFLSAALRSPADFAEGDHRRNHPRLRGENFHHNRALLAPLEAIAAREGRSPSQIALAWLLAQGEDVVPIPGSRRAEHVEENAAATGIRLSPADVAQLAVAFAAERVRGSRHRVSR
ncbi:aldo/keto reductase [Actinokineospora spheciospongiae]|nr:aldo/keto reductase [Actinokineospora spheciospongiae]